MTNVVTLAGMPAPKPGEPNQSLVDMLADLLKEAQSGRLQSMIGTGFTVEGQRMSMWCDTHTNVYEMLGSLAWLQHEYVNRIVEGEE